MNRALARGYRWLALQLLRRSYALDPPTEYDLHLYAWQLRVEAMALQLGSAFLPVIWNLGQSLERAAASLADYRGAADRERAKHPPEPRPRRSQRRAS